MYSRDDAKARAKKLRTILRQQGLAISHASSLEVIAQQNNHKDWNTLAATLDKRERDLPMPNGWYAGGDRRDHYDVGTDLSIEYFGLHPTVIRYKNDAPELAIGYAALTQSFNPVAYLGKRMQLSSTLKCEDCDGAVTIWLRADSTSRGKTVAFDNLEENGIGSDNGPISGTTDWTQRTIVLDIPADTSKISLGFYVRGKGAGYAAGFSMSPVSKNIPVSSHFLSLIEQPAGATLSHRGAEY